MATTRFLIATHGKLAIGFQSAINLLVGDNLQIDTITAFIDEDINARETIDNYMCTISDDELLVVMTDLMAGSVNQMFLPYVKQRNNVKLVTGINLPLTLEIVLTPQEKLTDEFFETAINGAKNEIKFVNPMIHDYLESDRNTESNNNSLFD